MFVSAEQRKDARVPHDVVIVDDDTDILEIVSEALREEGFAVAAFAEGASALAYARDHLPALVLTDLLVPPTGGQELIVRLRALYGEALPIVVMTAMEDRARTLTVPVAGVLQKPFELDELSSLVRRWAEPSES
jgi:DNA-binding response OmpR family regulator